MIIIGNHVSVSDGYLAMGTHAQSLGGSTFAFFPRNPRGGRSKPVSPEDVAALRQFLAAQGFGPLVVHGAYTMNVCAANPTVRANSLEMLRDDLIRLQALPGNYYNFHPGSHVGQGIDIGVRLIAEALNEAVSAAEAATKTPLRNRILLETMAGKGSEVGGRFEELKRIIELTVDLCGETHRPILGVCLDTCHVWDAGYDIRSDLDGVLAEFDRVLGLDVLCAIHLNDSKNDLGSKKDRHEKLGLGRLGSEALQRIVRHPKLQGLPFILETPNDDSGYRAEISLVRQWTCAASTSDL